MHACAHARMSACLHTAHTHTSPNTKGDNNEEGKEGKHWAVWRREENTFSWKAVFQMASGGETRWNCIFSWWSPSSQSYINQACNKSLFWLVINLSVCLVFHLMNWSFRISDTTVNSSDCLFFPHRKTSKPYDAYLRNFCLKHCTTLNTENHVEVGFQCFWGQGPVSSWRDRAGTPHYIYVWNSVHIKPGFG